MENDAISTSRKYSSALKKENNVIQNKGIIDIEVNNKESFSKRGSLPINNISSKKGQRPNSSLRSSRRTSLKSKLKMHMTDQEDDQNSLERIHTF